MNAIPNLCVSRLAAAKGLDADVLRRTFGLRDVTFAGQAAIEFPYRDARGRELFRKVRLSDGTARRRPAGGSYTLYGLDGLTPGPAVGMLLLVEGESDVWAARARGVQAIGIPGATSWTGEWAPFIAGFRCVLWEEPDAAGADLVRAVRRDLPNALVIAGNADAKDLCELHQRAGAGFANALKQRLDHAVPIKSRVLALDAKKPATQPRTPPRQRSVRAHDDRLNSLIDIARNRPILSVLESLGFKLFGRGANRTMRCPFHEDRLPSLSVNVQRGVWYCHGCGAKGDAIAFMRQLKGLDFPSAVRAVAS